MTKCCTIFLIGILSLLAFKVSAQEKLSLGFMLSPSLESFQESSTMIIDKPKGSYNFGVKGKYKVTDKISLRSGLIVYNKGRRYDAPAGLPPRELVNHIWFLSIPLTVDYKMRLNESISIGSSGGFMYGRKVWDFFIQNVEGRGKEYAHPYSYISTNFLGFTFGLGPSFKLSSNLELEVKPSYIGQLNDGWYNKWNNIDEVERLNSFLLDVTLWYKLRETNN